MKQESQIEKCKMKIANWPVFEEACGSGYNSSGDPSYL
jgi:hypothetical protein